jgi:hypothetical protein
MTARSPALSLTVMQWAFLRALIAWAARTTRDKRIALPSGRGDVEELRQVLVALVCAQRASR